MSRNPYAWCFIVSILLFVPSNGPFEIITSDTEQEISFSRTPDDGGCRSGGPDWLCIRYPPLGSAAPEVVVSPTLPERSVAEPPTPIIEIAGEPLFLLGPIKQLAVAPFDLHRQ